MPNTFTWNGQSSADFGIYIENRHTMNRSQRKFEATSVHGRNGNIYEMQTAWEEVIVSYDIFVGDETSADIVAPYTDIMEWLNSADGYAELTDTYDPDHYRQAVFVDAVTIEPVNTHSNWYALGQASISFRCRPERYIVTDLIPVDDIYSIDNETNHIAYPEIRLTGTGVYSLFKMMDKTLGTLSTSMLITGVAQKLVSTKDSNVWFVAYAGENEVLIYNSTYGSITSLTEGAINYSISTASSFDPIGLGWTMDVLPDTDYTLSYEVYQSGCVRVWFINQYGTNFIGYVKKEKNGSGWLADSITFHTPKECGYILISLGSRTIPTQTGAHQFRKVMLAYGTEAQPFSAYSTPTEFMFKVNDTTLTFTASGFNNAIIDCEKEDITIDGANGNPQTMLTDENGNVAEQYLHFVVGRNVCDFDGDIVDINIDPKFWEL